MKKTLLFNFFPSKKLFTTHVGIKLCALLAISVLLSCSKKNDPAPTTDTTTPVVTPQTVVVVPDPYSLIENTKITLSSYNFSLTNKSVNNAFAKIMPSNMVSKFSFSTQDAAYVYLKNDSLCLTDAGKAKLSNELSLDINVQIDDNGTKTKKPFKILYEQFYTNKVVAHRGAYLKLGLPENSIASLRQAFVLGCQGSEFDVHLTVDKKLIVCHDDTYAGLTIEKSTYDQLAAVKLSNGETLPLLKDFLLEAMKQQKTRLDLEIKPSIISSTRSLELADSVANMVHRVKAQAWIHYTSFDYNILKEILVDDPGAKVEYLSGDVAIAKLKADGFFGLDYTYSYYQASATTVSAARSLNLFTSAWTIDDKTQMTDLLNKNIDAILTNYPELLFTLINK